MNYTTFNENELVRLFQNGDEAALKELIDRHKKKIFTTIVLIVNDTYIAEDIFQETFIKVIRLLGKGYYREENKFLPWVIRIAKNMAIDHFRRSSRNIIITGADGEDIFNELEFANGNFISDTEEDHMIKSNSEKIIRQLIHQLPEDQKLVLVLRQYSGLSFKEIATLTNVSINTALGRMRYALINLRKLITQKELNLQ
jgi:RNA polymerase sigma-70 factor (ECF subfamily)